MVDDDALVPERGPHAAVSVGLEGVADGGHGRNDPGVIDRQLRHVVIGRARHAHQPASLGDGHAAGPVMTDVGPLLGGAAFPAAPFRNSTSRACLPTSLSRDASPAPYFWLMSAAAASPCNAPGRDLLTPPRH